MNEQEIDRHPEGATAVTSSPADAVPESATGQKSLLGRVSAVLKFSLELLFGGRNLSNRSRRDDNSYWTAGASIFLGDVLWRQRRKVAG